MHEFSICQSMLKQIQTVAVQHNAQHVSRVCVQIGPLSGVEPHLLVQAFSLVSADTIAEGAQLVVENSAVRIECRSCGKQSNARVNHLVCGQCGDWHTRLVSGDEMLKQILNWIVPWP